MSNDCFYPVFDISKVESDTLEQIGTKSKFWYTENGQSFLFKSIQSKTGDRFGEDWAEKISCELAQLLRLPHAHYELAVFKGKEVLLLITSSPKEASNLY